MTTPARQIFEFGPFRLDSSERVLWRDGQRVPITLKAFDLLLLLVERSGHIVEKDELMTRVWAGSFVEEGNLKVTVSMLRKALEEEQGAEQYIETVPRRGYRFVAKVVAIPSDGIEVIHEPTRESLPVEDTKTITERQRSLRLALLLAVTLLVILAISGLLMIRRLNQPSPATANAAPIKSIAVLPFKPLATDSRDESLELGMAETLITQLSSLREIAVRPTSAVRKYSGLDQDALAAGRELQVESVLEGSLQRAGDRLRVTVRFVRVTDGQTLWAERFDENFTDIFSVQDRVSAKVVGLLAVRLTQSEQSLLTKRYTDNAEAYELYLKGRYFWNKFTRRDHQLAESYFKQAIARDASYARAYVGLADTYAASATNSWIVPTEGYLKAKAAVKKALQLDDNLSEAHANSGALAMFYDLDWLAAEREYHRAIELDANYPIAYELYSYLLSATGRLDDSIAKINRALKADPLSVLLSSDAGAAYYWARRYEEAIKQYQHSIEIDPNDPLSYLGLGTVYEQLGRHDDAISTYQRAIATSERSSTILGPLGFAFAKSGRRDEALKIVEELKGISREKYVSPYDLAILYTGLGDNDKAIEQLNRAYDERAGWIIALKVEPFFDSLRSDPRFEDLVRRLRL